MTTSDGAKVLSSEPFASGLGFPESPRWHRDRLWLSDLAYRRVVAVSADGDAEEICEVVSRPSGLGWLPDGRLLVVAMEDAALLVFTGSRLSLHADLSRFAYAGTMNDMVVDRTGIAYVGQFGYDATTEPPRPVGLVRVTPEGLATEEPVELYRPNGCVLTPDGKSLLVAETHLGRISAVEVDDEGRLSRRRTYAQLPEGCWADGICLDEEGAVWAADPVQQRCVRIMPGGGITHIVLSAPLGSIACVLGGKDRRTLFVTVAALGGFDDRTRLADGRVDAMHVDVAGAGLP